MHFGAAARPGAPQLINPCHWPPSCKHLALVAAANLFENTLASADQRPLNSTPKTGLHHIRQSKYFPSTLIDAITRTMVVSHNGSPSTTISERRPSMGCPPSIFPGNTRRHILQHPTATTQDLCRTGSNFFHSRVPPPSAEDGSKKTGQTPSVTDTAQGRRCAAQRASANACLDRLCLPPKIALLPLNSVTNCNPFLSRHHR